jgi:Ca2+-transporting ATPase
MRDRGWHQKKIEEVLADLGSTEKGLDIREASSRLVQYGPNELIEKKRKTPLMMFLDQFKDFMIMVLIAAAIIAGFIGEPSDTIAIVIIVVLNAALGFIQEFRAERAMEALKKMAGNTATVLRGGIPATISATEVVPGDVVLLETGKVVPADVRLIEAVNLKADESALTGESIPVEKLTEALPEKDLHLGDRKNMSFKGTFATYGRARGVVTATGMQTEIGKIAGMLQFGEDSKTPLQKRLTDFGRKLAIAVLVICAVVFTLGIIRGEGVLLMLLTAVSLAVAAIPEALPAVITISLALGAKKLVLQNALIRKLPAVETLGSVTFICSDKTGTLTLNKMRVEEFYMDGAVFRRDELIIPPINPERASVWIYIMQGLAISNDAEQDSSGHLIGDPTETALYDIARISGFEKKALGESLPRIAEIPFDSERKCMTTFHRGSVGDRNAGTPIISYTKGALDVLIPKSVDILTAQGLEKIDPGKIEKINEAMAAEGMRILCLCMRKWEDLPAPLSPDQVEAGLTILGLIGLMDPPREEAKEAVSMCKQAGIKPVMITGDHPLTAAAIARRLGIVESESRTIITGKELENLPMEEFEERVEHLRVYARVAPEQKLKIVKALQDKGQFVAMTGDGVNDAPALKAADIGVAMGITGTDVSKEAADMILLDDNFATIVKAVKSGRRIFDNIRKFIKYTMTDNSGEIWTIFLAPFFGLPIPLLPIHILWINLITDGLPGLALAAEPAEKGLMQRPPRHPQESIFAHGLGVHIIWVGLLMGFTCIFAQAWSIQAGHANWQTMVFTILVLSQMGHVMAIRSETESLFTQGLLSNKPMLGALMLSVALQMATIYIPFLNPVFRTAPLTLEELLITLSLSCVVFIAVEIEKLIKRSSRFNSALS